MPIGFTLKQKDLAREGRGKFSSESHPIESRRVSAPSQFPVPDGVVISARANLELPRRRARFPRGKPFREPSRTVSIVFRPLRALREPCHRESIYKFVLDTHRRCTKPGVDRA